MSWLQLLVANFKPFEEAGEGKLLVFLREVRGTLCSELRGLNMFDLVLGIDGALLT